MSCVQSCVLSTDSVPSAEQMPGRGSLGSRPLQCPLHPEGLPGPMRDTQCRAPGGTLGPAAPRAPLPLTLLHHLQQPLLDELVPALPTGHLLLQSCTNRSGGVRASLQRGQRGRGGRRARGGVCSGAQPFPRGHVPSVTGHLAEGKHVSRRLTKMRSVSHLKSSVSHESLLSAGATATPPLR